jgi:gamma-glutamyl hercynylcysteine S-oxide synthase
MRARQPRLLVKHEAEWLNEPRVGAGYQPHDRDRDGHDAGQREEGQKRARQHEVSVDNKMLYEILRRFSDRELTMTDAVDLHVMRARRIRIWCTVGNRAALTNRRYRMASLDDPALIRRPDRERLSAALVDSRARTLRTFGAYERALRAAGLQVPYSVEVNPPLWELGHVGWFQEYWIGRNPQRTRGVAADPEVPRGASALTNADGLYDSSRIEHTSRWGLALPDAAGTRAYLARTLEQTLQVLARPEGKTEGLLYFAWLALVHEDMHHEAALYMANALDIPVRIDLPDGSRADGADQPKELEFKPIRFQLGSTGDDFAFDNELMPGWVDVERFWIDCAPVDNAAFAAFVDDGGYEQPAHWSADGWAWRQRSNARCPRRWRREGSGWQQRWFGEWLALDEAAPVTNLTWHEAQAWCCWAGRRLPTELEWEVAAITAPEPPGKAPIRFGEVWEWTASTFEPYPGFAPHPYRDYSSPWFGSRRVLRGGSFATHPRLRHPRYRNFFLAERNDIFAGFRSCAPAA